MMYTQNVTLLNTYDLVGVLRLDAMSLAVSFGVDINCAVNPPNVTIFERAVYYSVYCNNTQFPLIRMLLLESPNLNSSNGFPLRHVASRQNTLLFNVLVSAGANIEYASRFDTAKHIKRLMKGKKKSFK